MLKKRNGVFKLWVRFLLAAGTLIFANSAYAFNLREYYPLREGSKWEYQITVHEDGQDHAYRESINISGKEEISEVENTRMVSSNNESISRCLAIDKEGVKKFKEYSVDNYRVFNPPMMLFPSGLEIGESREYTVNSMSVRHKTNDVSAVVSSGLYTGSVKITLEPSESVVVPAGIFDNCLKFSLVYNYKGTKRYGENKYSIWLASGVGEVKEVCEGKKYDPDINKIIEFNELYELVSFSPASGR